MLVFVSRDFELGRNVSCEESTQSCTGLIYLFNGPRHITGHFKNEYFKAINCTGANNQTHNNHTRTQNYKALT